ncbi:hypothetical protein CHUAL_013883 [Chamberlinius hualienensis]
MSDELFKWRLNYVLILFSSSLKPYFEVLRLFSNSRAMFRFSAWFLVLTLFPSYLIIFKFSNYVHVLRRCSGFSHRFQTMFRFSAWILIF